jgi:DNA repair exonuclease SbcCD ATPase subunit
MKIVQIEINDIRSIAQMVMKPGALNIIQGDNGEGKTSVLIAIEAVFQGGHRPNLRRNLDQGKTAVDGSPLPARYAKKGEVKITLDNGTVITRAITEKRSTLDVATVDGLPVPDGPQHYVEQLASGFSFDPLAFCAAKPKERLAYLQRALGIEFAPDEVATACGMKPPAPVDLDGLDLIRKTVFETRTKINTLAKQAVASVERLSSALADDRTKDWAAEVERIQRERDECQRSVTERKSGVAAEANTARAGVNSDIDDKIKALEAERTRQLAAVERAEKEALAEVEADTRAEMDRLTKDLGTAQEGARRSAQIQVFRGEMKLAEKDAQHHKDASAALTAKLDAIDGLKKRKLKCLEDSIPGMEPRDGELYVDGLPFDDLNTGEQYMRAFQAAALSPGGLGMMIADRSETLGPQNWQAFQDASLNSGFQVFATRVTAGPLEFSAIQ